MASGSSGDAAMLFREEQRLPPLIMGGALGFIVLVAFIGALISPESPSIEQQQAAVAALAVPCLVIAGLYFGFKLVTQVKPGELHVTFPFGLGRRIATGDIAHAEVLTYRPLRDFGGWGWRIGRSGMMYNARGNRAVKLTLQGGKSLFIGSQRPEELAQAIAAARQSEQA